MQYKRCLYQSARFCLMTGNINKVKAVYVPIIYALCKKKILNYLGIEWPYNFSEIQLLADYRQTGITYCNSNPVNVKEPIYEYLNIYI
jgi:hypothetical protein